MRPFEILLLAAVCASLLLSTLPLAAPTLAKSTLPVLLLAVVALLLHVTLEGAHWQMIPAYLALVPAALLARFAFLPRHPALWPWQIAGLLLLTCASAACWAVPMFKLPAPTGPCSVGTSILYMADASRKEEAGPVQGASRELVVQLWYPAEAGQGELASYRRRVETTLESSYQALLPTHARVDAPVLRSAAPFPVICFNPAWHGRRTQNTFLTEELASHGYVVASIDHTYNSMPVAFPDGRVVVSAPVPAIETLKHTTPGEVERIGNAEADKQALDVRFVLDALARLNQQRGRWFNIMDTANAGSAGHSIGGAVSVQAWATDARIHAAMNLDGWTFGSQAATASRTVPAGSQAQPLLFLYEDGIPLPPPPAGELASMHTFTPQQVESVVDAWDQDHVLPMVRNYGGYVMSIRGTIHPTFTDKVLTSPLPFLSGVGPIDPVRAHAIIRDCAVQFFDQALKGKPSPLLNGRETVYPELVVRLRATARPETLP